MSFWKRQTAGSAARTQKRRLAHETLEDRRLRAGFSIVQQFTDEGAYEKILYIEGTFGRDVVEIWDNRTTDYGYVDYSRPDPRISVHLESLGGTESEYAVFRGVDKIVANLKGGDDEYTNSSSLAVDVVFGGSGADLIRGGHDVSYIDGGDGPDHLYGRGGDDWIYGGRGDDWLFGEYINGRGAFYCYDRDGDDHLFGGEGVDHLRGQFGDDYMDGGFDFVPDIIYSNDEGFTDTIVSWNYRGYSYFGSTWFSYTGQCPRDTMLGWDADDRYVTKYATIYNGARFLSYYDLETMSYREHLSPYANLTHGSQAQLFPEFTLITTIR
jgi:hypothetical protein